MLILVFTAMHFFCNYVWNTPQLRIITYYKNFEMEDFKRLIYKFKTEKKYLYIICAHYDIIQRQLLFYLSN